MTIRPEPPQPVWMRVALAFGFLSVVMLGATVAAAFVWAFLHAWYFMLPVTLVLAVGYRFSATIERWMS